MTQVNPLLDYSDDECNACEHVNGQCPYHAGVQAGLDLARGQFDSVFEEWA